MKKILFTVLIAFFIFPKSSATVYKVGNAWENPNYETLSAYIAAGVGKAATDEIWLAGVHEIESQWEIIRWQSKLYGGFAGTETSLEQRELNASGLPWDFKHPTTIRLKAGSEGSILFTSMSSGQQASLTEIDGIVFDGSNCTKSAIFLRAFTNAMTIRNCVIENTTASINNILNGGTDDYIAGAITVGSDDAIPTGTLVVEGCLIQNNSGRVGGVFSRGTTILNCVIRNNEAKTSAVGVYNTGAGGGVYTVGLAANIINCIIDGNKAAGNGGGIYNSVAETVIQNSVIANNTAANGSALFLNNNAECYNSIFYNNEIGLNNRSLKFSNNIISTVPSGATASNNIEISNVGAVFAETTYFTPAVDFLGQDKGTTDGLNNIPETDFAGNARLVNTIDIGPYETGSYSVNYTVGDNITVDTSRSNAAGLYAFGDEYKIYFTVSAGVPIPNVAGSSFTLTTEDDNAGVYVLTATVTSATTIQLITGTPRYMTLDTDIGVKIMNISAMVDDSGIADYIVADGNPLTLTFSVPDGRTAAIELNGQALTPAITSESVYTVETDIITADFVLMIRLDYEPLPELKKVSAADIDWDPFLAQHDMYWTNSTLTGYPNGYFGGTIMGNGLLGTNLYKQSANVYRLNVGRTDLTEGRINYPMSGYTTGSVTFSHLYDEARLPIGSFRITPVGTLSRDTVRLSLYNAITRGILTTNRGRIDFRTYVHAEENYIVFESAADAGEADYKWTFEPDEAVSPRYKNGRTDYASNYRANPNPAVKNNQKDGDYTYCVQNLATGRAYVVMWRDHEYNNDNRNGRRIIATVAYEDSEASAIAVAKATLDKAFAATIKELEGTHKEWWNSYYPRSFATFDNTTKMESFYWAQIYKFACSSREGKPIVDIMGPWPVVSTPWCAVWMNLNTQLTYSWMARANRSELSKSLWQGFKDNRENLVWNAQAQGTLHYSDGSTQALDTRTATDAIAMARSSHYGMRTKLNPALYSSNQYEVANMTWLLFYYWQDCVYNNNEEELTGDMFDLLKSAINYYFYIRKKLSDGKWHLPVTASPEYNSSNIGADVNYDLASLRWGLQALIDINDKYSLNDSKRADWQGFLDDLVACPEDAAAGYKISATTSYTASHRHWSHLLMIYPYYTVNWDNVDERNVITKSVDKWQSLTGSLQGYSYSGSSCMYASMGDGERAYSQLNKLISNGTYIRPNTLYYESGNPVFETPMSAVAALHDMYIQSWGDKIRIFYAVPDEWNDASFIGLRTEGAFLVSASRKNGKNVFIQVESEAGGVCKLQTGMDSDLIVVRGLSGEAVAYTLKGAATGLIEINMQAGDVVQILNRAGTIVYPSPVEHTRANTMKFGVNTGPAPEDWKWDIPSIEGDDPSKIGELKQGNDDPIVDIKYFTMMGKKVSKPNKSGIYVVQNIHASGKTTASKVQMMK